MICFPSSLFCFLFVHTALLYLNKAVLKMNQFNGVNGCPTCLNPGVRTVSQYYPPDDTYDLRTNESVVKNAEDAEKVRL